MFVLLLWMSLLSFFSSSVYPKKSVACEYLAQHQRQGRFTIVLSGGYVLQQKKL
jgi:hypothetical protein